ncbi:MAG: VOC family protein [Mycolicibacterium sp.]|uniref:VOC family protein n=1 Tax=Mycolicibacterium sp. TaxID=2320850 RepID=UPI003D09C4B7
MTGSVPGKVSWFEVASNDVEQSARFYGELFGWVFNGDPGVYLAVDTEGDGISGGIIPATPNTGTYATFGVEVDDVDAVFASALAKGATAVVPPTDNPGGVRSAYLRDADGSLFAVYRFVAPPS